MKKWLIPVDIIVFLVMMIISGSNSLVKTSEGVNGSWSQQGGSLSF